MERFDVLAKSVAGATTRREALWRVGKGLALTVLASFGLASANPGDCAQCCAFACRTLDVPPRGPEMALCITQCHETGIAVGPTGQESAQCVPLCVAT